MQRQISNSRFHFRKWELPHHRQRARQHIVGLERRKPKTKIKRIGHLTCGQRRSYRWSLYSNSSRRAMREATPPCPKKTGEQTQTALGMRAIVIRSAFDTRSNALLR